MKPSNIDRKVWCDDCARWLPTTVFLNHWHEATTGAVAYPMSA